MARRAVLALNIFPTSFILVAPYAEALYLALSIGAFLATRVERRAVAGLAGLGSALARVQGWLLAPALLVDQLQRRRSGWSPAWALLPTVGPVVLLGIDQVAYGDALFFVGQQAGHFYHSLQVPWIVVGDLVAGIARADDPRWPMIYLAPLLAYALLTAVAVWSLRSPRARPAFAVYVGLTLAVLASVTWPISAPRYAGALFPVSLAWADVGRDRRVWLATSAMSVALLAVFTAVFAAGGWAF